MKRVFSLYRDIWRDQSGIAALEFAIVGSTLVTLIVGTVEISNAIRIQAKVNVATGQLAEFVAGQLSVAAAQWTAKALPGTLADLCNGAMMNLAPYPVSTFSADIVSLTNDHPGIREPLPTPAPECYYYGPFKYCTTPTPPVQDYTSVHTYLDWEDVKSCATTATTATTTPGPLAPAWAFDLANNTKYPNSVSLLTKSGTPAVNSSDTANLKYGYSAIVVQTQYTYTNVLTLSLGKTINFSAVAIARPRSNTTIQCTTTGGTAC